MHVELTLTREPIGPAAALPPALATTAGAQLEFRRVVRCEEENRPIAATESEAYPAMASLARVKTAVLSRATAGTRGQSLMLNRPGKSSAVREGRAILAPAILEGIAHLRGEDPHANAATRPAAP